MYIPRHTCVTTRVNLVNKVIRTSDGKHYHARLYVAPLNKTPFIIH